MNSEKVKEIKKALKYNILSEFMNRLPYADEFNKLKMVSFEDILTLINELESENERIKNIGLNEDITVREWLQENQKLKDRIAELEKENSKLKEYIEGNEQDAKAFVNGWHKDLETELKHFAERLKEDFTKKKNKLIKEREIAVKYGDFILIDALAYRIDELQYAIDNIDETLKERINDK
jgi:hypothetical protein